MPFCYPPIVYVVVVGEGQRPSRTTVVFNYSAASASSTASSTTSAGISISSPCSSRSSTASNRNSRISRFSSNFDPKQIADFLENCSDSSIDLFDMAFMEGSPTQDEKLLVNLHGNAIPKVLRKNCILDKDTDRLGIGQRGKLGGPSDGKTGIVDLNGYSANDIAI